MAPPFKQPGKKRKEFLESATRSYEKQLEQASTYLEARGISIDAAKKWRLGYVDKPLAGHERFRGYLAIPYLTSTGVVHMKFRCIQDHEHLGHEKYDCEAGSGTRMFGVMSLSADSPVHGVCEGELDAVVATEQAGIPSVAIPGVSAWKSHYPFMFEGCQKVVVFSDGDESGQKLAKKVISSLYNDATEVAMPPGMDVNSFVAQYGGDALRERAGISAITTDPILPQG